MKFHAILTPRSNGTGTDFTITKEDSTHTFFFDGAFDPKKVLPVDFLDFLKALFKKIFVGTGRDLPYIYNSSGQIIAEKGSLKVVGVMYNEDGDEFAEVEPRYAYYRDVPLASKRDYYHLLKLALANIPPMIEHRCQEVYLVRFLADTYATYATASCKVQDYRDRAAVFLEEKYKDWSSVTDALRRAKVFNELPSKVQQRVMAPLKDTYFGNDGQTRDGWNKKDTVLLIAILLETVENDKVKSALCSLVTGILGTLTLQGMKDLVEGYLADGKDGTPGWPLYSFFTGWVDSKPGGEEMNKTIRDA